MRSKSYYFIFTVICTLLFTVHANAATSTVSTTISGLTVNAQSYSTLAYDEQSQIENTNGNLETVYKWHLAQNIYIQGLNTQYYYNGYLTFCINTSASLAGMDRNPPVLTNTYVDDGLNVYIRSLSNTYYYVMVIFDNYIPRDGMIGLPTITQDYYLSRVSTTPSYCNFTSSFIDKASSIRTTGQPDSRGLVEMIEFGVGYAINNAQEFDDIITILGAIRDQDPVYYNQIISGLGTLHADITNLINEVDLDFDDVQTILDLFPNYTTQVLLYWQQFLEMNAAQSSEAAEQESKYADGESQANNMVNNMEAVGLPSISNGDLDILGSVDGTQKANFFGVISLITHTELVTKIMLIIVIGAMVGFIMYGKKGG